MTSSGTSAARASKQVTEVVVIVALADEQGSLGGRVADEGDANGVTAALQALDDEPALLVGEFAANGHTVAQHRHGCELHR